ncbi:MAG: NapC/NirT family cytochrome c [candidate division KSB1 bacterium]|nr:NapC/NirT family cytochrome c [candidate division KSB1 bacterium]MDQ7063968.1 NapC/NirT family cytochrome c [candidate division KSB1 bacterium]
MAKQQDRKVFDSFYNSISLFGAFLAVVTFALILFLIIAEWLSPRTVPYLGILTYIVLPVFLILGLVLIPIGMWREHRRRVRGLGKQVLPRLDLNNPKHRRGVMVFMTATGIFLFFTGLGTYRAYEFSDSVTFCGQVCHKVMEPEYKAYQTSPHARVKCVECHVGPGATWFVRSKLSGAYQVYSVLFNKYQRPIPTPIENLRPAQETCEQCHWPAKFYGDRQVDRVHFLNDEENTRWKLKMVLKIGGGTPEEGYTSGIHWHMNIANKIEYVALDEQRQVIPWVRMTDQNGNVKVFKTIEDDFDEAALDTLEIRRMDCIDCHNRPSHQFKSPQLALNIFLETGKIDPSLPYIKSTGVELLDEASEANSYEEAFQIIENGIYTFYRDEYPEIFENKQAAIDSAISVLKRVYRRNFFPYMRANWKAYPENIGHLTSPGCYRCHDGMHVAEDGQVITNDCSACHLIIEQGDGKTVNEVNIYGLEFRHPEDIDEEWRETGCYECHGPEE